ncbi:restriction endonuclease [Pseudomonas chengduensis]|nr:restriction endonuclease [Pseudomonas chengduensis]MDH1731446.1 restriction endonuclease [Pseudomonas chengduensis]
MPPRTNEFQKLVKIINKHLAPADAKITESAMIFDREAGINREVDILIETNVLNCNIKIGVECTTTSRKLDIKKIEELKEKHRRLGINQSVVVAKNGFSQTARNYAEINSIKLLSFSAAKRKDWLPLFEHLRSPYVYGRTYFIKSASLKYRPETTDEGFDMDTETTVLFQGKELAVLDFCNQLFSESQISRIAHKELKENEENGQDPWVSVGFSLEEKYEFKNKNGKKSHPIEIEMTYGYISNYQKLGTEQLAYDDQYVLVGNTSCTNENKLAQAVFSVKNGALNGTIEFNSSLIPKPPASGS